ncbi:hypothetical protein QFZ73_004526 [Peribacillus sp. V2I11]|nr:hypothetical protein [Peribacillus sp. V2I11]
MFVLLYHLMWVSLVVVHSIIKKEKTLHNAHTIYVNKFIAFFNLKRLGSRQNFQKVFNQGGSALSNIKNQSGSGY